MSSEQSPASLELFGTARILHRDGTSEEFAHTLPFLTLAFLALHPHAKVSKERLYTALWEDKVIDEEQEETIKKRFRQTLYGLRQKLGDTQKTLVRSDESGVSLDYDALKVDVQEFEAGVRQGLQAEGSEVGVQHLQSALSLYRGELLQGFYEEWILQERSRLEILYLRGVARLVILLEQKARYEEAIQWGYAALKHDPSHHEIHLSILRLYAKQGDAVSLRQHYEEMKRALQQEMDTKPSATTEEYFRNQLRIAEQVQSAVVQREPVVEPAPRAVEPRVTESLKDLAAEVQKEVPVAPTKSVSAYATHGHRIAMVLALVIVTILALNAPEKAKTPVKAAPRKELKWNPVITTKSLKDTTQIPKQTDFQQVVANVFADRLGMGVDVVVDPKGNTYLFGNVQPEDRETRMFLVKFDQNMQKRWSKAYPDTTRGMKMQIDTEGNFLLAGNSETEDWRARAIVLKCDKDGKETARGMYAPNKQHSSTNYQVTVGEEGSVLTGGHFRHTPTGKWLPFAMLYNKDLKVLEAPFENLQGNVPTGEVDKVALEPQAGCYYTAFSREAEGRTALLLAKWSYTSKKAIWVRDNFPEGYRAPYYVYSQGHWYVLAYQEQVNLPPRAFVAEVDLKTGNLKDQVFLTLPNMRLTQIAKLVRGSNGNLWVSGECVNQSGIASVFVAKMSATGKTLWHMWEAVDAPYRVFDLLLDNQENAYAILHFDQQVQKYILWRLDKTGKKTNSFAFEGINSTGRGQIYHASVGSK